MELNKGWKFEKGFGRFILRIYIMYILKIRLQFTCMASMVFRKVTISVEIRLSELK